MIEGATDICPGCCNALGSSLKNKNKIYRRVYNHIRSMLYDRID